MRLTDTFIAGLKPPAEGRAEYLDDVVTGLRLRIGQSSKTWVLRVRAGKMINQTLGRYPSLSLAAARRAAKDIIGQIAEDGTPRAKQLFEDVSADFVKRHCMVKNKRWREQEKQLAAYVLPSWKGRDIGSLRRRDVVALMDELTDRGLTTSVNRVLSLVHKLFRWAQGRDLLDANPAAGVAKPAKENVRDRVLTEKEIAALWSVTGHMGYPFGTLCRLLLLTGQRLREVSGMTWADIDLERKSWLLAAADTKAARKHLVPLSTPVVDILDSLPRLGEHVLTTNGKTPISGWSKSKAACDQLMVATLGTAPEHWTFHDLRRTLATHCARIGIQRFVISRVLNHAETGVTGVLVTEIQKVTLSNSLYSLI